tara:strand:- start:797 stop:985 length:189 start_codon:yes stop_codon:yes gene_type:complete
MTEELVCEYCGRSESKNNLRPDQFLFPQVWHGKGDSDDLLDDSHFKTITTCPVCYAHRRWEE